MKFIERVFVSVAKTIYGAVYVAKAYISTFISTYKNPRGK
jgi:hypothetical protein